MRGQRVFDRLAALPCPTVAAINGFALGGGLELALACRYRVAVNDGRAEPRPARGAARHPSGLRRHGALRAALGVREAMELMLTGRPLRADEALAAGLVDRLVPADELRARRKGPGIGRPAATQRALARCAAESRAGAPMLATLAQAGRARARAANTIRRPTPSSNSGSATARAAQQAYEAEARSIAALMLTPTARNLVRVFLLQDRLKALGGKPATDFKHVHVVGAGVMGGDIAAWCALRGLSVTLQDRAVRIRRAGAGARARAFRQEAPRCRTRRRPPPRGCARISPATACPGRRRDRGDLRERWMPSARCTRRLEPRMKPGAMLATNTSSIMLEQLACGPARSRPARGPAFLQPGRQDAAGRRSSRPGRRGPKCCKRR